ncbi:MAG: hypothetical protein ACRDJ5_10450 [Actinomycetota bacterium]
MRARILVAAVSGALLVPMGASATHLDVSDPNDSKGRLDIREVVTLEKPARWRIRSGVRWRVPKIWDKGYFYVFFDTTGDEDYERYAFVRSNGRRLVAGMWRQRRRRSDVRESWLRVRRSSPRNLSIRVPSRRLQLPPRRRFYAWETLSQYLSSRCSGGVCLDRTRRILEPLGEG